jgi:hypothetical protein
VTVATYRSKISHMNDDTILRKIQKAMALANDKRGDQNTAAIALRQAQAMMEKYGITEQKVLAANCTHTDLRSKVSVVNPTMWEVNIINFVAKAFGCRVLWTKGGPAPTMKGYWTILGPKSYVEVALYTVEVTLRQILKARSNFVKNMNEEIELLKTYGRDPGVGRAQKSKMADEFCLGWGWAVEKEIHKMADPDGLIKAATDAYASKIVDPNIEVKINNKGSMTPTAAMMAGAADGKQFKIHRPMNTGPETLKIG